MKLKLKRIFSLLTLSLTSCTSSTVQETGKMDEKALAEHNIIKFIYDNGHKLGKDNDLKFTTWGMNQGKFKTQRCSANFSSSKKISLEEAKIVAANFLVNFLDEIRKDPAVKAQFTQSSDEEIMNNFCLKIYYFMNKKDIGKTPYISKILFEYNTVSYFSEDENSYDHLVFQESLADALKTYDKNTQT